MIHGFFSHMCRNLTWFIFSFLLWLFFIFMRIRPDHDHARPYSRGEVTFEYIEPGWLLVKVVSMWTLNRMLATMTKSVSLARPWSWRWPVDIVSLVTPRRSASYVHLATVHVSCQLFRFYTSDNLFEFLRIRSLCLFSRMLVVICFGIYG